MTHPVTGPGPTLGVAGRDSQSSIGVFIALILMLITLISYLTSLERKCDQQVKDEAKGRNERRRR
eukprot:217073-Hanusia_phi.AAC.1